MSAVNVETSEGQETGAETETPSYSQHAQMYLDELPEAARAELAPFVQKWDAGVTRKFQELQSQVKGYADLGNVEELQAAKQITHMLRTDPKRIYDLLHQQYGKQQVIQGAAGPAKGDQGLGAAKPDPQLQGQLAQLSKLVETMALRTVNQDKLTAQQQEDQELESYLGLLKKELGDFDEDYVLVKMSAGMSGEDAVRSYRALVGTNTNVPTTRLPSVLSGGGASGVANKQVTALSRDETQELIASIMGKANG